MIQQSNNCSVTLHFHHHSLLEFESIPLISQPSFFSKPVPVFLADKLFINLCNQGIQKIAPLFKRANEIEEATEHAFASKKLKIVLSGKFQNIVIPL